MITGAAGPLGAAASRRFRDAGARLVLVVRSEDDARRLREEFRGTTALIERVDIGAAGEVQGLVERVLAARGRIDVLLNLVGVFRGGRPVTETSEEDFDLALSGNLKTVFLTCRALVPHMIGQRWGRIINMGARSGLQGRARSSLHAAAKGGVILFTEALAEEVRDSGVTANVLIPSTIDTPANRKIWPKADYSAWVPPEHLAETMLFLCSDHAQSITGARITIFNRA